MNMRETSSAFMEDKAPWPPLPELYHPKRGPDCTLGGDATAVMGKDTGDSLASLVVFREPCPVGAG